jgi:hypothetical protein
MAKATPLIDYLSNAAALIKNSWAFIASKFKRKLNKKKNKMRSLKQQKKLLTSVGIQLKLIVVITINFLLKVY